MMSGVQCVQCGSQMTRAIENWSYRESGVDHVILERIEVRRCPNCGNVEPVIPNIVELHRTLARAFASRRTANEPELAFLATYVELSNMATMKSVARFFHRLAKLPFLPRAVRDRVIGLLCGAALLVVEQEEAEETGREAKSRRRASPLEWSPKRVGARCVFTSAIRAGQPTLRPERDLRRVRAPSAFGLDQDVRHQQTSMSLQAAIK
jgi:hypothetical protein